MGTICYKKAIGANLFIWQKMFMRHCAIQALLLMRL